jgi:hypothetical protein
MSDLTPRPGGPPPTPAPPPGPQYAPEGYAQEEMVEGIHLREVIAVLRRHAWLVVLVTMATLGIATWLVLSEEPGVPGAGTCCGWRTPGAP